MSNTIDLGELKSNRQALLLAELAALLHDVGKFTDLHIKGQAANEILKWSTAYAYKVVVDDPAKVIILSKTAGGIKKPDIINNVLSAKSPKAADFLTDDLKIKLTKLSVNLLNQDYLLAELIMLGMPGFATNENRSQLLDGKDGWLPALLGLCHNLAHVDKEEPICGEQLLPDVLTSSAFGYEQAAFVIDDPEKSLNATLKKVSIDTNNLIKTREQIIRMFEKGLGDTRRPINEVSLADWSAIVAALFKTALAGVFCSGQLPQIRSWANWKEKIIDHDFNWRILRVNFDVLGLYTRAIKIADLLGYQKMVNKACDRVKQLLEVEYPLGNEVYRDTTGIYFTFPDISSLPTDLEKIIRNSVTEVDEELAPRIEVTEGNGITADEKLKHILAKARDEARQVLAQPFDSQNYSSYWQGLWAEQRDDQKWEVCPVCRLRPVEEGLEACPACLGRRRLRIEDWQENPGHTIWIDEIADHNGRVALLTGKFGLDDWLSGDLVRSMLVRAVPNNPAECRAKNPSPARLRRVWETCLRFWSETVEQGILEKHAFGQKPGQGDQRYNRLQIEPDSKKGWKENVAYDGTVDGKPVSLYWLEDLKCFITIINLQMTGELREGQEITVGDPDHPRKIITFIIQNVHLPGGRLAKYKPFLPLLTSPDQFLALVPAADAPSIAERIREAYTCQFGKVQNRLPLFWGSVFFQRKLPLLAVIDAGRRMLDGWNPADEAWVVKSKSIIADGRVIKLQLAQNGRTIDYDIPIKMGDGKTADIWYPYFRMAHDAMDSREFSFEKTRRAKVSNRDGDSGVGESVKKEFWVHAKDLRCGDTVCVRPSRFAYTFLEQTAQRFRFDPLKDLLLLDELPRLKEMWAKLKEMPEITDTKMRGIQALLEAKQHLWGPDDRLAAGVEESREPFRRLVETTFRRERIRGIGVEEVLDGSFERCLEIYLRILKQRIKEEEQDD